MPNQDLDPILERIQKLAEEIETFVPQDARNVQFRADLGGLLVVAITASYESCVKETLVGYAGRHNAKFQQFAQNQYARLSSRIKIDDLKNYAKLCDDPIRNKFAENLKDRKKRISLWTGVNIVDAYEQMLRWRNDYAHEGLRNTTVEEALKTHRHARHVLYAYHESFA